MYIYLAEINSIFVKLAYLEVKYQFVTAPFSHFERTANKRPSFSLKKEKKSRENVRRFLPTTKSSRHNVFFPRRFII